MLAVQEINAALIPTEPSFSNAAFMETEANPSALDEEESFEGFDSDDNDIPNFSDIETMVNFICICVIIVLLYFISFLNAPYIIS